MKKLMLYSMSALMLLALGCKGHGGEAQENASSEKTDSTVLPYCLDAQGDTIYGQLKSYKETKYINVEKDGKGEVHDIHHYFYDDKGRIVMVRDSMFGEQLSETHCVYDEKGRLIQEYSTNDGKDVTTKTYQYDADDHVVKITQENSYTDGNKTEYGSSDYITTYVYRDGKLQEECDVEVEHGTDRTLEEFTKKTYTYHADGSYQVRTEFGEADYADSEGPDFTYYDADGRCYMHMLDGDTAKVETDSHGRIIRSVSKRCDEKTTYQFDSRGNWTEQLNKQEHKEEGYGTIIEKSIRIYEYQ